MYVSERKREISIEMIGEDFFNANVQIEFSILLAEVAGVCVVYRSAIPLLVKSDRYIYAIGSRTWLIDAN